MMDKFLSRASSNPNLSAKRPREESTSDCWREPKRFVHRTNEPNTQEVPTKNRFAGLPIDSTDLDTYHKATKKKVINNTPPIIIEILGDFNHQKLKEIVEKYTKDYHLQFRGQKTVKLQCYSPIVHQAIKDGLRKENIAFHTFTRKDEKCPKAVIKGLPKVIHDLVPEELTTLGFTVATASTMKTLLLQECPPLLVQLASGTDMAKFNKIKYLSNCVIEIQRYKPSKKPGTQCFRCQGFGHASRNCNRPAQCVKCAQLHPTWECPKKDKESPAQCCNCQQDHPANYGKCTARLKYIDRTESRRQALRKSLITKIPNVTKVIDSTSWAQIVSGSHKKQVPSSQAVEAETAPMLKAPIKPQEANKTSLTIEELTSTSTSHHPVSFAQKSPQDPEMAEMLDILSVIQSMKREFTKCKTFMEKVVLILTHLGHYV